VNELPRKLPIWPGAPAASSPRKHVPQRRGPDCAIAAAATITGVTYDEAASVAFSLREEGLGGMRPQMIIKLLYRLSETPWRIEWLTRSRVRLSATVFPDHLVLACIASPWLRHHHAIVARERVIYDGSLDAPVSPADHPHKDWYPVWLLAPGVA
jgi:hypothetical protein